MADWNLPGAALAVAQDGEVPIVIAGVQKAAQFPTDLQYDWSRSDRFCKWRPSAVPALNPAQPLPRRISSRESVTRSPCFHDQGQYLFACCRGASDRASGRCARRRNPAETRRRRDPSEQVLAKLKIEKAKIYGDRKVAAADQPRRN